MRQSARFTILLEIIGKKPSGFPVKCCAQYPVGAGAARAFQQQFTNKKPPALLAARVTRKFG